MSKRKYFKRGDKVMHRGRQQVGTFSHYALAENECYVEFEHATLRVTTSLVDHYDAEADQQDQQGPAQERDSEG